MTPLKISLSYARSERGSPTASHPTMSLAIMSHPWQHPTSMPRCQTVDKDMVVVTSRLIMHTVLITCKALLWQRCPVSTTWRVIPGDMADDSWSHPGPSTNDICWNDSGSRTVLQSDPRRDRARLILPYKRRTLAKRLPSFGWGSGDLDFCTSAHVRTTSLNSQPRGPFAKEDRLISRCVVEGLTKTTVT